MQPGPSVGLSSLDLDSMGDDTLKELGFPAYWNKRYENASQTEGGHEWFRSFEKLRPFLERELPNPASEPRLIHLGCGDSVRLHDSPIIS